VRGYDVGIEPPFREESPVLHDVEACHGMLLRISVELPLEGGHGDVGKSRILFLSLSFIFYLLCDGNDAANSRSAQRVVIAIRGLIVIRAWLFPRHVERPAQFSKRQ
jgi:hypothetical protein